MSNIEPTWKGEVQLRRWSNSSTQGVQVTFALADEEELGPLTIKTGKRFYAVLVEMGDDEAPVQPQATEKPARAPRKDTRGPLCREACDYCAMPEFWDWLSDSLKVKRGEIDEARAASLLRVKCAITSRNDLDRDPLMADIFRDRIRVPFIKWQRQERQAA